MRAWGHWAKVQQHRIHQHQVDRAASCYTPIVAAGSTAHNTNRSQNQCSYDANPSTLSILKQFVLETMGCGTSKPSLIESADGGEEGFHERYLEDKVLGQGEFGVVKLVHDMRAPEGAEPLACKVLRKGVVFKDNTLWAPLDPKVLQQECDILRTLNGKHYCLRLEGIYETPKQIYMVTELCSGGEMMEYVSKQTELRTEDVSRIANQLLSAVNHCAKNKVIHRDIKPENCMFKSTAAGADLRLIDFGSGCIDKKTVEEKNSELLRHTTFAGSAFYISPEMFQKTYTSKTDVWSCGVTLYVLVAGYPADELQKAFNILQKSKGRKLKKLPNLPDDMPDSYLAMLEKMLTYRHKSRPSAEKILAEDEFISFYKNMDSEENILSVEEIAAEAANGNAEVPNGSTGRRMNRTQSVKITGSVHRHAMFLGYQKFERSVTTLLATMLSKQEFVALLDKIEQEFKNKQPESDEECHETVLEEGNVSVSKSNKLGVIPISDLKKLLNESGHSEALKLINELPNSSTYDKFAYHTALLKQFAPRQAASDMENGGGRRTVSRNQSVAGDRLSAFPTLDDSIHSTDSKKNSSIHGNNVFKEWKSGRMNNPRKNTQRSKSMAVGKKKRGDGLDNSWHLGS